ncbi:bifunctional 4-hydroxy-2-oxoglutarate aldolase/2-dehydro-3-deoxy-phosphogluconate aldolase [Anderseniella sp. Alg231-50]|uniref:bifunctional 4-hydroxy-2-oxoglutarate aldolase/2-dehydro-3-deoxy-phosphogluconate aldolase n=1 Tax=Anderseniella sp. Alg231-50 TaxID=1922226 RepID=UPI000D55EE18
MLTGKESSGQLRAMLHAVPIVPVLVVHEAAHAVPLAQALVSGGLPVVEVTLRTPAAIDVIKQMSSVAGCVVGVGTLVSDGDVSAAIDAGARFGVSPGTTETLVTSCARLGLPLLGGVATVSEMMRLNEHGFDVAKFFPAEASGGAPALKAFAGPMPDFHFCPTGGLNPKNVEDYLKLPNVLCAGGSWIVPPEHLKSENWSAIEKLAAQASKLSC